MKTRKPPLSSKTAVSRALDSVERAICLELAGHKCERCGATEHLQWCHIVQRGRKSLQWTRENSLILCGRKQGDAKHSCHYWLDNLTTDHTRYQFVNKLKPDVYKDFLDAQVSVNFDLTLKQMKELLMRKKQELALIKAGGEYVEITQIIGLEKV